MPRDPFEYPRLRMPVDMRLDNIQGQEVLVIRCPIGVSSAPLVLLAGVAPIVSAFDGNSSIAEIAARFSQYGVQEVLVRDLVRILDQHLFLNTPGYVQAEKTMRDDFAAESIRQGALCGGAYPADPARLDEELDAYLNTAGASGCGANGKLAGLIAPHIDYRRGGAAYGKTYAALAGQQHDVYVLLGTAHQYSPHMFHLTRKDFAIPSGNVPCEREFVEKLAASYGKDRSFADEVLHKKEHSIELQLPFIVRAGRKLPSIVPVLVGGLHHLLAQGQKPCEFEEYESFVSALTECLKEWSSRGQNICLIAAADMAHVGRNFGDAEALSPEFMAAVRTRDEEYLSLVRAQDKDGLFKHISADGDARRVCGFPVVYTLIDVLDRLSLRYRADLFAYDQAVDYRTDCAVTFAGVGIYCLQ